MRTEQIQEFLVLCQHKNLGLAADLLAMSQSTLSRHILQMEEELGFTVFDRNPNGVELNENGRFFYQYALSLQSIYGDAVNTLARLKRRENNAITIGIASDSKGPYNEVYNKLLLLFSLQHPDCTFFLQDVSPRPAPQALREAGIDFYLHLSDSYASESVDSICILSDPVVIVLPADHPACPPEGSRIELSSLSQEHFILPVYESPLMKVIERVSSSIGFLPQPVSPPLITGVNLAEHVRSLHVPAFWAKSDSLAHPCSGTAAFELLPTCSLELRVSWLPVSLSKNKLHFIETCKSFAQKGGDSR